MRQGIHFQVDGLEKALLKLEKLKEVDRKKARQFKAGIRKAAKPMVRTSGAAVLAWGRFVLKHNVSH